MHTGARARKQKYISIYISFYMKTFLKTGVYIYIYIFFMSVDVPEEVVENSRKFPEENFHILEESE